MPEFLEDPSVLTKDRLKNELVANNVTLPSGEQRKDVYVQLYLQHLTSRNRGAPDFSSDEEKEATPVRARGRPPGRKASKKTDKPNVEEKSEKTELDVTELSRDALKEELLKYGITPGPIMATTRKVYEKQLIKVKEQQATSLTSVADTSNLDRNKQNGNTDPEQYSDIDESKISLALEARELIRGKSKTLITSRSKSLEQYENISGDGYSEPVKTLEPEKVGRVQSISKESSRVVRRTPRKRVVASEPLSDDAVSETSPVTETILPSSNQAPVDNQVTETFYHTNALRSFPELSDLSRRTPKKQLLSEKHLNLLKQTDAESLNNKVDGINIVGRADSSDLLNTALIEILEKIFYEDKKEDRDILKEMFPYETLTPTGISASCRRPIKGASGRPFIVNDYEIEEAYTSKYVSQYQPVLGAKVTKPKTGRSIPMWIKILIFVILAVFLFLVYQVMETNEGNPFSVFLQGSQRSNKGAN